MNLAELYIRRTGLFNAIPTLEQFCVSYTNIASTITSNSVAVKVPVGEGVFLTGHANGPIGYITSEAIKYKTGSSDHTHTNCTYATTNNDISWSTISVSTIDPSTIFVSTIDPSTGIVKNIERIQGLTSNNWRSDGVY